MAEYEALNPPREQSRATAHANVSGHAAGVPAPSPKTPALGDDLWSDISCVGVGPMASTR